MLWLNIISPVQNLNADTRLGLSDFSDIAQVIIALFNIFLAIYIFVYQRRQNLRSEQSTATIHANNHRLQWFKELIIQPKLSALYSFYSNLEGIKDKIDSDTLSDDRIIEINRFINDEAKSFRINFYDAILQVDKGLYTEIKKDVESLVTTLTTAVSDDEHKLKNIKTFEREIADPIRYSKHNILSYLLNFKG